jgi:hypothetical protein
MKYNGGFSGKRHAIVVALSAIVASGCGAAVRVRRPTRYSTVRAAPI